MDKLGAILSGFKNLVWKSPTVEKIALERSKICSTCNQYTNDGYIHCNKCKCYLPAKIRSMDSKCPLKKWNK